MCNQMKVKTLDYWRDHSHDFPHLNLMARDTFAVPATGAGVERMFSKSGRDNSESDDEEEEQQLIIIIIRITLAYRCEPHHACLLPIFFLVSNLAWSAFIH